MTRRGRSLSGSDVDRLRPVGYGCSLPMRSQTADGVDVMQRVVQRSPAPPTPAGIPQYCHEIGHLARKTRPIPQTKSKPSNITLLYVAGHSLQTTNEGRILLMQNAGVAAVPAAVRTARPRLDPPRGWRTTPASRARRPRPSSITSSTPSGCSRLPSRSTCGWSVALAR
jgi:hypothetical protein